MAEERSKIEDVRRRLYGATKAPLGHRRRLLPHRTPEVPTGWEESSRLSAFSGPPRRRPSPLRLLFLFAALFFLLSVGLSAFFFFGGSTTVSSRNIEVRIEGPTTVRGGEELALSVTVENRNAVALELADLIVEFPEGTRAADDFAKPLPRIRESLGTILPGESRAYTARAALFGEEGKEQEIAVTVEYRLEGSNAIFYKEASYRALLASAPLRLSIKALTEAVSGQPYELAVTVESNADAILKKVLLTADYPPGFTVAGAEPKASFGNSAWTLGDLPVGAKRTVTIRGTLSGQDGEERTVRFAAGLGKDTDEKTLAAAFVTGSHAVTIKRPFLAVTIALNGSSAGDFSAARGRTIRADIGFVNNTPSAITDARIEVALAGAALDKNSVTADRGFYRSQDATVLWSGTTNPALSSIPPGGEGTVSFTFAPLPPGAGGAREGTVTLSVDVSGTRASERGVPERLSSSATRQVKVATDLLLVSRALYYAGPLTNAGPLPPKAEKETTYTVLWSVTNSSNAVSSAAVTATLPPYVRFMDVMSPATLPAGERLTYNALGGTVTWTLPSVAAGAGYTAPPREVAFQVGLTPSVSQVGSIVTLINETRLSGTDQFTETSVGDARPALSTALTTDPSFRAEQAIIAP